VTEWNQKRQQRAVQYRGLFLLYDEILQPYEPSWARSVYHLYVIRVQDRENMQRHLADVGIGTGIHYPIPLHLQAAYRALGFEVGDFPITEKCSAEILSLPMHPRLEFDEQSFVVQKVVAHIRQSRIALSVVAGPDKPVAA